MPQKELVRIASKTMGEGHPTVIIAEAGVNHNAQLDLALQLVDAAAAAGADAVKFQTFKAEQLVTATGEMAAYQKKNIGKTESQRDMLKKLELHDEFYAPIMQRCQEKGILFLSTPHGGFEAVDQLAALNVAAFKFGSGDLTNIPVIAYAAKMGIPMIFGTGMATLEEVKEAVQACRDAGNTQVAMMHCTTNYPCPLDEVDLRAMQTMMNELPCQVGYSDHTLGIQVPIMAVALGATVIEKHFTLSRDMEGPDHKASLEPNELAAMVAGIRNVEAMEPDERTKVVAESPDAEVILGSPEKKPHASEADVTIIARKSVVTLQPIKAGEEFTKENLGIKRPGNGMHPRQYLDLLGKTAKRDIAGDVLLHPDDV